MLSKCTHGCNAARRCSFGHSDLAHLGVVARAVVLHAGHDGGERADDVLLPRAPLLDHSANRVISDCHFPVQLNHFIPGFLSYSVAVFSKVTIGYNPKRQPTKSSIRYINALGPDSR